MKHAASVRPEPGSNSPLSESLCPRFLEANPENCSTLFNKSIATLALSVHYFLLNQQVYLVVFSYSIFNVRSLLKSRSKVGCLRQLKFLSSVAPLFRLAVLSDCVYIILSVNFLLSSDSFLLFKVLHATTNIKFSACVNLFKVRWCLSLRLFSVSQAHYLS